MMNNAAIIHIARFVSFAFPAAIADIAYAINPIAKPSAIEYVRGIAISVMNAGMAIQIFPHSILASDFVIIQPTIISAGAVIG